VQFSISVIHLLCFLYLFYYLIKKEIHICLIALPLEDLEKLLKCKSEHIQMFDKTNIPIRHHYMNNQRIGDLILDMQTRWTVARYY
jgi:hypothetical protein